MGWGLGFRVFADQDCRLELWVLDTSLLHSRVIGFGATLNYSQVRKP